MKIRKASISDLDTLIRLRMDYLYEDMGDLMQGKEQAILEQLKTYFKEHMGLDFFAYLAEEDGMVIASAFLAIAQKPANPMLITGKSGTVLNVFTYPEYRKKGIASALLKELIMQAEHFDLSFLELRASPMGKPLYEKLGFKNVVSRYDEMRINFK